MGGGLKRPIERIAYRRDEAAAVFGLGLSKFEDLVRRGIFPKPVKIDGCTLYDARQLELAWAAIMERETAAVDSSNPYDQS